MITEAEKQELKKVLGHRYTTKVLEVLLEDNLVSKTGNPFTANMVRTVFNGKKHDVIEAAIYKAAKKEQEAQEAEQLRREHFLQTA